MKIKDMTITRRGGWLFVILAGLSVIMFGTSCNDEYLTKVGRTQLLLSVTTDNAVVTRAVIDDGYLPDGALIRVTAQ